MTYRTEQEAFWAGEFGNEYLNRNKGDPLLTAKMFHLGKMISRAAGLRSIVEFGCNIGLNLAALHRINPAFELCGYEINAAAAKVARELGVAQISEATILEDLPSDRTYDLAFTSGVLIHIDPAELGKVYQNLYNLSSRYILVYEYYNPTPVTVQYRGHDNRLFKRDFAGELMDQFGLRLVDYGFCYHRDNYFPQDDGTWVLMEK
jgi:pseudaminic acid biosynthesis-associated methylase